MLNFLIQNAIDNIWCSPQQDRQYIIKPFRLSRSSGALDYQKVMWERVILPTLDERYHVYQIGHIHPKLLGIISDTNGWKNLAELINETNLMGNIYFVDGQNIPRGLCFIRYDDQKNLIMAVKDHPRFQRIRNEDIFFRTYTNAIFESERVDIHVDRTFVKGYTATDNSSILHLQSEYNQAQSMKGHAVAFINGYMVDDLNIGRIQEGDYIEYVHDTTILKVIDFDINDLKVFDSILDTKRKYLLSYEDDDKELVHFEDDIDIYLFKREPNGRFNGTYYHHNNFDAIRMLTHRDYAVPVDYIQAYSDTDPQWDNPNTLTLRFYIREAGLVKTLVNGSSKVAELYKLEHPKVVGAMIGVDSTLDVWRAEQLEMSAYTSLMRSRTSMLDPNTVVNAYGYSATSRVVGDSPVLTDDTDGVTKATLPFNLRNRVTVYEYDTQGLLLGYYNHTSGSTYVCTHAHAAYCEVIAGFASNKLSAVFGELTHHLSPHIGYRAYTCTLLGNGPAWDWRDALESGEAQIDNGTLTFDVNANAVYTAVLNDRDFVGYSLNLGQKNGVYKFTISSMETHDGIEDLYITTIPPRTVEVWLNGHSLVEDIDFIVNWPEVTVTNKQYLIGNGNQNIVVRCTGFCNTDLSLDKPMETGFVKHGLVGYNDRFNIRDAAVFRCSIGGKLVMRDDISFHEDILNAPWDEMAEGKPYAINEIIIPMRGQLGLDTYVYRNSSLLVNQQVSDYMSVMYPLLDAGTPPVVSDKHQLYSPFLARVINNVLEGIIPEQNIRTHYNDSQIQSWLESEHYLLDFDPLHVGYDQDYVIVHPHRFDGLIEVDAYQRSFIQRVVDLYFDSQIDIDAYLTVNYNL